MNHLFVPYELALKLKEKGFDEECFGNYDCWSKNESARLMIGVYPYFLGQEYAKRFDKTCILAPLYQQVIDWLLIKHQISIEPEINPDLRWIIDFVPNVTKTHKGSGNFTFFTDSKKLTNDYQGFSTKYEALNKAIEEALKLIL